VTCTGYYRSNCQCSDCVRRDIAGGVIPVPVAESRITPAMVRRFLASLAAESRRPLDKRRTVVDVFNSWTTRENKRGAK